MIMKNLEKPGQNTQYRAINTYSNIKLLLVHLCSNKSAKYGVKFGPPFAPLDQR